MVSPYSAEQDFEGDTMSKNTAKIFYAVVMAVASGLAVWGIVITAMGNNMGILAIVGGVVMAIAAYGERGEKMKEAVMRESHRELLFEACMEALGNPLKQLGFADGFVECARKYGAFKLDTDFLGVITIQLNKIPKETREEMMRDMDEQSKSQLQKNPVLLYKLSDLFPDQKQR